MRYDLTVQQVAAVVAMLPDDGDEQLRADMLEGETNLYEFASKLLAHNEDDEGVVNALAEQIDDRKVRQDRAKSRIAHRRDMLRALLDIADIDKLALPEATVSRRSTPAKIAINDPKAVPEEYCVTEPKPSAAKIAAAFTVDSADLPNWLRVEPEKPSITVRRK